MKGLVWLDYLANQLYVELNKDFLKTSHFHVSINKIKDLVWLDHLMNQLYVESNLDFVNPVNIHFVHLDQIKGLGWLGHFDRLLSMKLATAAFNR